MWHVGGDHNGKAYQLLDAISSICGFELYGEVYTINLECLQVFVVVLLIPGFAWSLVLSPNKQQYQQRHSMNMPVIHGSHGCLWKHARTAMTATERDFTSIVS